MESNVVNFITENIFLFLPVGITGIIATIALFYMGRNDSHYQKQELEKSIIKIYHKKVDFFLIIYTFIVIMMSIIGIMSEFLFATLIGGTIALIPILITILLEHRKSNKRGEDR